MVLPDLRPSFATEEIRKHAFMIIDALEAQASVVHLLADHGGICEKEDLEFQLSGNGLTQVVRALR